MYFIAYLDEFGHVGPYLSHDHPNYKTHPVFGLGGIVIPYKTARDYSMFFFKLKKNLLEFEINRSSQHPAQWEKKGSSLYTVKNITKYIELRKATFRYLNKIKTIGGFIFYVGIEKRKTATLSSKGLYHSVLKEAIKRLDQECGRNNSKFLLILDQHDAGTFRSEIVKTASISMFGPSPRYTLLEPPIQVESHLYQTLQCADWICGIVGRLSHYDIEPDHKRDFQIFNKYFKGRINALSRRSSIRKLT